MNKYMKALIIGGLILIPSNVLAKKEVCSTPNGYNAIVEIDKDNLKIGDQAFIAVDSTASIENIYYGTRNIDVINVDKNGIIKAQKAGKATIVTTITFNAENKCTTEIAIDVLSNDATLKKLNLNEYDLSNIFSSDKYDYEIKVPYKTEEVNISAEANNSDATINGIGKKYLNVGDNKLEVTVTAPDKTTASYKLNVIREKGDSDNSLKTLEVAGYSLIPEFSTDNKEYKLELDENVDEITINASANSNLAKVRGIGTHKIVSGESTYFINVIAEDGSINKYTIVIFKKKGVTKLTSLSVEGYNLEPKFNEDEFTYYLNVGSDIQKLNIKAVGAQNDNVEITGNDFLEFGQNEILIKVSNPEKSTNTYKLIVNKMNKAMEKSIAKNFILVKVLLVLFITSVIIMGVLIGIFVKRNYIKKPKLKKDLKKKYKK